MKLTEPQRFILWSVCMRRPQRCIVGYKPAEKLRSLGLVTITECLPPFGWEVTATDAGRQALAQQEGRDHG